MRHISEDNCSCCWFLGLWDSKKAAVVAEHISLIGDDFGQYSCFVIVSLPYVVLWTVKEDIFLDWMSVKIKEDEHSVLELSFQLQHQILQRADLGNQIIIAHLEGSIEVSSAQRSTEVANNHTVWIYHWHHFEDHIFPQESSVFSITAQVLKQSLSHKTRTGLSWVNSAWDKDAFFLFVVHFWVSNGEQRNL